MCYFISDYRQIGAVAQLGERLNGIQEVDGSIPFSSTILIINQVPAFSEQHSSYATRTLERCLS
jgi:hypothetical protein